MRSRRPLIAVTTAETLPGPVTSRNPVMRLAAPLNYLRAISDAGGVAAVCFPHQQDAEQLARAFDGLLVVGGPDINPAVYGQTAHPEAKPVAVEQDDFEIAMIRAFAERERPVLGVCRGLQLLNVAYGGTLHQHLPDLGGSVTHRASETEFAAEHGLEFDEDSRIAALVRAARADIGGVTINSFHHQAADKLGGGLRVAARAADGIVEAVEHPDHPFLVGVQWHPESMQERAEQRALFTGLLAAA